MSDHPDQNTPPADREGACRLLREEIKRLLGGGSIDPQARSRFDESDVAQNTLLDLLEHERLDELLAKPGTDQTPILRKTLAHDMCDEIRKARAQKRAVGRERPISDDPGAPGTPVPAGDDTSPSQAAIRNEKIDAVTRALAGLPDDLRRAVVGFKFEGSSHEDVARLNGWSVAEQHNHYQRGLRKLRKLLDSDGGEP